MPDPLEPELRFAIVPEWVLDLPVSDRAVRLYALLARYSAGEGAAFPSLRTLQERLGCGRTALREAIDELRGKGAIAREERHVASGRQTTNRYVLAVAGPLASVGTGDANGEGSPQRPLPEIPGEGFAPATPRGVAPATPHYVEGEKQEGEDQPSVGARTLAVATEELAATGTDGPIVGSADSTLGVDDGGRQTRRGGGRARDELWEALVAGIGHEPTTRTARGVWNRALAELRAVGITPNEILGICRQYRAKWPEMALTPMALAKHVDSFREEVAAQGRRVQAAYESWEQNVAPELPAYAREEERAKWRTRGIETWTDAP